MKNLILLICFSAFTDLTLASCAKYSLEIYAEKDLGKHTQTGVVLTGDLNDDGRDDVITSSWPHHSSQGIAFHYSDSDGKPGSSVIKGVPNPLGPISFPGNKYNYSHLHTSEDEDAFHIGISGKIVNHSIVRVTNGAAITYAQIPFDETHRIRIGKLDSDGWTDAIAINREGNLYAAWGTEKGFTKPKLIAQKIVPPNTGIRFQVGGSGIIVALFAMPPDTPSVTILDYKVEDFDNTPELKIKQILPVQIYPPGEFEKTHFITGFGPALVVGKHFFIRSRVDRKDRNSAATYVHSQLPDFTAMGTTFADLNGDGSAEAIILGNDGLIHVVGPDDVYVSRRGTLTGTLPEDWEEITNIGLGIRITQVLAGNFNGDAPIVGGKHLGPYMPDELVVYSENLTAQRSTLTYLRAVCTQ